MYGVALLGLSLVMDGVTGAVQVGSVSVWVLVVSVSLSIGLCFFLCFFLGGEGREVEGVHFFWGREGGRGCAWPSVRLYI